MLVCKGKVVPHAWTRIGATCNCLTADYRLAPTASQCPGAPTPPQHCRNAPPPPCGRRFAPLRGSTLALPDDEDFLSAAHAGSAVELLFERPEWQVSMCWAGWTCLAMATCTNLLFSPCLCSAHSYRWEVALFFCQARQCWLAVKTEAAGFRHQRGSPGRLLSAHAAERFSSFNAALSPGAGGVVGR